MLVKYEFLKILRKKSTLIVMAISLILTGVLFGFADYAISDLQSGWCSKRLGRYCL